MKRNVSLEMLRIIGCILVIWAHIQLPLIEYGELYHGRLFISSMIGDDVPIFLLITGFFLFQNVELNNITQIFKKKLTQFLSIYGFHQLL